MPVQDGVFGKSGSMGGGVAKSKRLSTQGRCTKWGNAGHKNVDARASVLVVGTVRGASSLSTDGIWPQKPVISLHISDLENVC